MRVNVFITHRAGGSAPLWRGVPLETAKRVCSLDETRGENYMLVWSREPELGLHPERPRVDDGRFDHLLTPEEKRVIECWTGEGWKPIAEVRG